MKLKVWTKIDDPALSTPAKNPAARAPVLLFDGDWPTAPRLGEFLNVFDFGSGAKVLEVWHNLDKGCVEVYVPPDWSGEYLDEAKKRGIPQPFHV